MAKVFHGVINLNSSSFKLSTHCGDSHQTTSGKLMHQHNCASLQRCNFFFLCSGYDFDRDTKPSAGSLSLSPAQLCVCMCNQTHTHKFSEDPWPSSTAESIHAEKCCSHYDMLVHNQGKHRAYRLFVLLMKKKEEGGRVKDVFCVFTKEK